MEYHEVTDIFPLMSDAEFGELVADIREHGLRDPIWTHEGKIVDGRNRHRACEQLGITPAVREWDGRGSLVAFVVSMNLHRRHLDESQRALVGARIKPMFEDEARERQRQAAVAVNTGDEALFANLQKAEPVHSGKQAAAAVNVSPRSVENASRVIEHGAPALVRAVESGKVAVSTAATITELPKQEQEALVAIGEREILDAAKEIRSRKTEARREERMQKLADVAQEICPLNELGRRFPVLYADPPWQYEHAESDNRVIENHYPTMRLSEIWALPVGDVTTDDCVLFLWATSPKLAEAVSVIVEWGFTYRTCMVWVKDKIGMGYYARQKHELLLIATKGQPPAPAPDARPASVIEAPRAEHSEKPEVFHELIERMYPGLPKLEMFARRDRDGWVAWGNEVPA